MEAVPIAITVPSTDADVLSLAQWGAASPLGLNDLTEDDKEHQFYLGQLSSDTYNSELDFDMDHLELAQAEVGKVGFA